MIRTGIFNVINGESRLSDGTLLAVCSDPSPLVAARPFLLGHQCQEGQSVQVSGVFRQLGGVTAFCMSDARPTTALEMAQDVVAATRLARPPKGRVAKKKKSRKQMRKPKKTSRPKLLRNRKKPTRVTRRKRSK
jgi:hypothetical protein